MRLINSRKMRVPTKTNLISWLDRISSLKTPNNKQMQQQSEHPRRAQNSRSVSFSPIIVVRMGLKRLHYTDDEIQNCWFTRTEIKMMSKEVEETLQLMEDADIKVDNEQYCSRGIESIRPYHALQKYRTRQRAYDGVMETQFEHYIYNGDKQVDPAIIAEAYTQHTTVAMQEAYRRGLQDQRDVLAYRESSNDRNGTRNHSEKEEGKYEQNDSIIIDCKNDKGMIQTQLEQQAWDITTSSWTTRTTKIGFSSQVLRCPVNYDFLHFLMVLIMLLVVLEL